MAELARIAALPPTDPELAAIRKRIEARAVDLERRLAKFLDSPPGFGFRGTSSAWMNHMDALAKLSGTTKSLTLRPQLAAIRALLARGGNPWQTRLTSWGLLGQPFAVAARPSTKLRQEVDAARDARIAAELARLGTAVRHQGQGHDAREVPGRLRRADQDPRGGGRRDAAAAAGGVAADDLRRRAQVHDRDGRGGPGVRRDDRLDAELADLARVPGRRGPRGGPDVPRVAAEPDERGRRDRAAAR